MSINRLRQILQSQLVVKLDSSAQTVGRIQQRIAARRANFAAKQKPPIKSKTPAVVAKIQSIPSIVVRPVDLLRKLGLLTTPSSMNMSRYSASWATRRYFWAIEPGSGAFRLSSDARQLDFHQKTLLSDEFGIGMAGLIMERLFQAPEFSDISSALKDPKLGVSHLGGPQPDYLMWRSDPASPYFVVECKGCQTVITNTYDQLRRAMEQLPTIRILNGSRQVISLVIATLLEQNSTKVIIIDPPDDEKETERRFKGEEVSEKVGPREWVIPKEQVLRDRSLDIYRSQLLKWCGQLRLAAEIDETLEEQSAFAKELRNIEPEVRNLQTRNFVGFSSVLFPELGEPKLQVFQGLEEHIFRSAQAGRDEIEQSLDAYGNRMIVAEEYQDSPFTSIGSDGTCFDIEGLQ